VNEPAVLEPDPWLGRAADRLAEEAELPRSDLDLREEHIATILDAAAVAAHASGRRTNAPLLCFLLGVCVGRGSELEPLRDAIAR
jgi:hypothetical protein